MGICFLIYLVTWGWGVAGGRGSCWVLGRGANHLPWDFPGELGLVGDGKMWLPLHSGGPLRMENVQPV